MTPGLTLEDWDEVLALERLIPRLTAGELRPAEARIQLNLRRAAYPGVRLDYVRVIEAFGKVVDQVQEAVEEQNKALNALNASIGEMGETFSYDPTRLLTAEEREALHQLQEDFKREKEDRESEARNDEEEAEMMEQELESLQEEAESLAGEAEGIEAEIEGLIEALESMEGDE